MRQFSGAASYVWVCSGGGVGGATWEYRQLVCSGILFVVMCAGLKCLQMDRALWKRCTLWEWEKFGPEGDSGEMLGGARGGKDSFGWCFENVRWLGLNERFWLKNLLKLIRKDWMLLANYKSQLADMENLCLAREYFILVSKLLLRLSEETIET